MHQNKEKLSSQTTRSPRRAFSLYIRLFLQRIVSFLTAGSRAQLRVHLEEALLHSEDKDTIFSHEERLFLSNILRLRSVRIQDIMIPRVDIQAVEDVISLQQLIALFCDSGHSRLPVYHESLDDPRGMIHIRDVLTFLFEQSGGSLSKAEDDRGSLITEEDEFDLGHVDLLQRLSETPLIRPLLFVPPSMPATALMAKMQASRVQMALVIDEYGGTEGLVSLEDLIETVVGDIEDEHDEDVETLISPIEPGVWSADARVELQQLQQTLGEDFSFGDLDEDVDTLGGFLFTLIGRVPVRGEVIRDPSLSECEFTILEADPRRLKKIRIDYKGKG